MIQSHLPNPLNKEIFNKYLDGIFDNSEVNVYINDKNDFAFLWPIIEVNYNNYKSRAEKLGLKKYSSTQNFIEDRYNKLKSFIIDSKNVLEIGASNGLFLKRIKQDNKGIECSSCETDKLTLSERKKHSDFIYNDLNEVLKSNNKYDIVCFFHVFEHIKEPSIFLSQIKKLIHKESLVIIEVPSLDDPLISIYKNLSYKSFYFQAQHPSIYSRKSLNRVMEFNNFETLEHIPHQRYGLENHLEWLSNSKSGGNTEFLKITNNIENIYKLNLEKIKMTDSIIWVGKSC